MPDIPDVTVNPALQRKLTTILAADVSDYSRLMSDDEEQTLRTFRGHREIFEALVTTHQGRIFNTAGDAILAEFSSAVEAVRCATEIQTALRTKNEKLPVARQILFRIGINLGDVMVQNDDLLGDGVNVAARLQTSAAAGGICISGSVYDQIQNKLSLSFRSLGERKYKNISHPIRTFSIVEAEGRQRFPTRKNALTTSRVLTVLLGAIIVITPLAGASYWFYFRRAPSPAPAMLLAEPPSGSLPKGHRILVNDESCPAGQIKELVGGSRSENIPRQRRCVVMPMPGK